MKTRSLYTILYLIGFCQLAFGQNTDPRIDSISTKLDTLAKYGVPLQDSLSISMPSADIQEFVFFLAESSGLNITIDEQIQANVSFTFSKAIIKDILLHLCEVYDLELKITGSILRLIPFQRPPPPAVLKVPKIQFQQAGDLLSVDLQRDTLLTVAKSISEESNQNIVLDPKIHNLLVNGFVKNAPLEKALEQLAMNNNLFYEKREGYYYLAEMDFEEGKTKNQSGRAPRLQTENLLVKKINQTEVLVKALEVPILDIIKEVAITLDADYFLLPEITNGQNNSVQQRERNRNNRNGDREGNSPRNTSSSGNVASIQMKAASFDDILFEVTKNSDYTYTIQNGLAIIGKRTAESLRNTVIKQLQYRSAKDVIGFIPEGLLKDVEIDTLFELNSLVFSGSDQNILEIEHFLDAIDQKVPVVTIELTIVDVQTNLLNEIGMEIGNTGNEKELGGIIIGGNEGRLGPNYTFGAEGVNKILNALAGANIVNLGSVPASFFLNLKAIEEKGLIEIKSTPKLSTLNSHLASLSIGQTRYYQIQEVNFPGLDRPIPVQSNRFQSVDANLDIDIMPIVSGEGEVTLEIYFEQSEFIDLPENAPPPQVSRKFESIIRVANEEMIVLGGLERESDSKTKAGVPVLARIPVLGWFFGKKKRSKSKNKLLVFVKPSVLY